MEKINLTTTKKVKKVAITEQKKRNTCTRYTLL